MLQFDYELLVIIQLGWIGLAVLWMLYRNDEIPLLISFLIFYVTGYRYWAVTVGLNSWVNLSQFGIIPVTAKEALQGLGYLVLGQSSLLVFYFLSQTRRLPRSELVPLNRFLLWLRPKAIWLGLVCLPLVIFARSAVRDQIRAGRSLAFGISAYLYQFPFVLVGIATLIMCLWKFGGLPKLWHKFAAVGIIVGVANLSFATSGRFQLIGWLATAGVIFSCTFKPKTRLLILGSFVLMSVATFALAGALRGNVSDNVLATVALDRFIGAEDANMLDGFAILTRFFPDVVPYRLGMTHLEILLRPIPRAIWPDKPAGGGYLATAGLSDASGGFTIGISPTLFGDFYTEGGVITLILLAAVYGIALGNLIRWTFWLHPFAAILIRAMVCAGLVPILRGGDLAGIVAWLGMAFWPCFLILWLRRKDFDLKRLYQKQNIQKQINAITK